jgi:hypothetical protein
LTAGHHRIQRVIAHEHIYDRVERLAECDVQAVGEHECDGAVGELDQCWQPFVWQQYWKPELHVHERGGIDEFAAVLHIAGAIKERRFTERAAGNSRPFSFLRDPIPNDTQFLSAWFGRNEVYHLRPLVNSVKLPEYYPVLPYHENLAGYPFKVTADHSWGEDPMVAVPRCVILPT